MEQGQPMGAAAAEATVSTSLQGEALSKEGMGETIPRLSLLLPSVPFWPNLVGSQLGREAEQGRVDMNGGEWRITSSPGCLRLVT